MTVLRILGVALLVFGVLGLRLMARRSVSLAVVRALRANVDPAQSFEAAVESRIDDAVRHGLLRQHGESLLATPRGRAVAAAVRWLRRGFGVRAR